MIDDLGYDQVGYQLIADLVVSWVKTAKKPTYPQSKYPFSDFVYYLIGRLVESNDVTVEKLWFWVDQFGDICGSSNKGAEQLACVVRTNRQLTLDLQYFVLFESLSAHSFYKRVWLLRYRVSGLSPTSEGVIELLQKLDHK